MKDFPQKHSALAYMARHGRSFRFASRFMPAASRRRIAGVYAWCRYTDDLVDRSTAGIAETEARLDEWLARSRSAYEGRASGVPLLDEVFGDMREQGVPFLYAETLGEGVRMDLRHGEYRSLADLDVYTYRVASVVGLWLTNLFGVRDRWALDRAARLGHAMQLTNILRDVGEDLAKQRLYLPLDRLGAHGLTREDVDRIRLSREPVPDGYAALMEELMMNAERAYADALEALPSLPMSFRVSVAVAARVYAGIHDSIRARSYDTLRQRAYTSAADKLLHSAAALGMVLRVRRAAGITPMPTIGR